MEEKQATALVGLDVQTVATVEADLELCWGKDKLAIPAKKQLARLSVAYGLDPFLGHFEILGGKIYVTQAALLHHSAVSKTLIRLGLEVRPLTKAEREEVAEEMLDGEIWRKATLTAWHAGLQREVTYWQYGKAGGSHETNPIAKGKDKMAMAEKRAANRCLRLAYSIAMPSIEEMGSMEPDMMIPTEFTKKGEATISRINAKVGEGYGAGGGGGAGPAQAEGVGSNGKAQSGDAKEEVRPQGEGGDASGSDENPAVDPVDPAPQQQEPPVKEDSPGLSAVDELRASLRERLGKLKRPDKASFYNNVMKKADLDTATFKVMQEWQRVLHGGKW